MMTHERRATRRLPRKRALACAVAWLLFGGQGVVQAADPAAGVAHAAAPISISVQHAEVSELFETLSRQSRTNILLGNGVEGQVSVSLYDVSLDRAVRTIAEAAGFAVEHNGDSYFIVKRDEAGKDMAGGLTVIRSFKIQYTNTDDVTKIVSNHLSRYGKITALPDRHLIVVEDLPDFVLRIENLLGEIDRQPVQIMIEAQVLEVRLDRTQTYGLDWKKVFTHNQGKGGFGLQGLATPGAPGLFMTLLSSDVEGALSALDEDGRVHTLSTPKLLALEHQEAQVVVGDRLGYRVTTTINQVTTESVDFIESGVILKVTPFVDRSGRIMMQIHPEVSTGSISDGIPSVKTTEVTTQLPADDGQPIFIGGLIRNSKNKRRQGVPVLRDLPLVGGVFRNLEFTSDNTETVVLITPHIIRSGETAPEVGRLESFGELKAMPAAPAGVTSLPEPPRSPLAIGD